MKNMKKVPWHIIISAMILTMLVLATSKVFAHGEGRCFTSASRNTFLRNGSFMKVVDHLEDAELRRLQGGLYKHGHRNQYYDRNGNPTTPSTAFFDIDGLYDVYVDCPTASQPPSTTLQRTPVNGCDPEPERAPVSLTCDDLHLRFHINTRFNEICHEWDFYEDYDVGIPVLPIEVETIAELWSHIRDTTGQELEIKFYVNGGIRTYDGSEREGHRDGNVEITPHFGFWVNQKTRVPIGGIQRYGMEITLSIKEGRSYGIRFIGFPEVPANYQMVSDLLGDGITRVDTATKQGKEIIRHSVTQPGDEGDIATAGMGVVVRVDADVTLDLRGVTPSAPQAQRQGTLATTWGAMKQ